MILERLLSDGVVTIAQLDESAATGPYLKWMQDAEVTRFLEARFAKYDAANIAAFISEKNASNKSLLAGIFFEGRHVGNIKLDIVREHSRGELGLLIGEKAVWGRGIARRAIALISDYAFSVLGLAKICAGVYATNIGSQKAFESVGYHLDGVRRRHYVDNGVRVDAISLARFNPLQEPAQ